MNLTDHLKSVCAKAYLPAAALIALLQRTPAIQNALATEECVATAPVGAVLSSIAIAAASLGAVDAMAGATLLASTITEYPTGPLPPLNLQIGKAMDPVAFTIANLIAIGSWKIVGEIPPGLFLTTAQPNGGTLIGYGGGNLDATTDTNELTTPVLEGTPTVSGTYQISFQGFWKGGESGGPYGGKGVSAVFPYTIVVSSTLPTFNTQPLAATVTGGTIALNALAVGASSYQWMLNGSTPIAGATGTLLMLNDAAAAQGTYTCVASNDLGSTTSSPATISILATPDIGRLTNISTRSQVGTGSNILIAGFAVGGSGTNGSQALLVRGSGPALVPFGLTGTLPDPQLQLFSGSAVLGTNAAWAGNPLVSATDTLVGAFAWASPTSKDAALLESLPAGAYTAQIAGQSGDTGVALAEVYDATPAGGYTPTTPRIINLSARVQVGTGDNILIAGFVIGGSTSRTVLIRASGPGLDQFGVGGTLDDPLLQVYAGTNLLVSNQGWGGDSRISNVAASVNAFAWLSPFSKDSAIIATLPPGSYTAQVSGATGDTGVALIEIYEVP